MIAKDLLLIWARPDTALGAATEVKSGKWNTAGFRTIEGTFFANGTQTTATCLVNHYDRSGNIIYQDSVAIDSSQTANTYSFDLELRGIYVQVVFTSQGAATITRALAELVP